MELVVISVLLVRTVLKALASRSLVPVEPIVQVKAILNQLVTVLRVPSVASLKRFLTRILVLRVPIALPVLKFRIAAPLAHSVLQVLLSLLLLVFLVLLELIVTTPVFLPSLIFAFLVSTVPTAQLLLCSSVLLVLIALVAPVLQFYVLLVLIKTIPCRPNAKSAQLATFVKAWAQQAITIALLVPIALPIPLLVWNSSVLTELTPTSPTFNLWMNAKHARLVIIAGAWAWSRLPASAHRALFARAPLLHQPLPVWVDISVPLDPTVRLALSILHLVPLALIRLFQVLSTSRSVWTALVVRIVLNQGL
jgi:hypothetical protein